MKPSSDLREQSLHLLRLAVGHNADFRDGQWEAIESLVRRRARLLVVQRTGWGKSIVYFLTTRLLRDQGAGPTLLVSPLLALMRNQMDAAKRLAIKAATINATNQEHWEHVEQQLRANDVDVLLISPERLANEQFELNVLTRIAQKTGLFVVDEAHCISDWGHDFRPDYRRIVHILKQLPPNIPVCATTATANSRVLSDVVSQLGPNLEVCRGPLVRESLRLQTVPQMSEAAKLAWLAQYLPQFKGSGIVYTLTVRWTERIARWLNSRGITAAAYSADLSNDERLEKEEQLLTNKIKALVATTALGMGYDKPDLGFVVHFHQPASVIHYYQQVGRAGRAISQAYGVMLSGGDDRNINDYFIENAFPTEEEITTILEALEQSEGGLKIRELEATVNIAHTRMERALKMLAVESPAPIVSLDNKWLATAHLYDPGRRRQLVARLTQLRCEEQAQMDAYLCHRKCLMEFLARALDDPAAGPCRRCAPCVGKPEALRDVRADLTREAGAFLRLCDVPIEPRKQWRANALTVYNWRGNIAADRKAEPGRALCILGDSGWGELVRRGKYQENRFDDELVEALANLVCRWHPHPTPTWMACIPSLNHPHLVPDLAQRLAARLQIPFVRAVRKVRVIRPQKQMENSWHQLHNLDGAFAIDGWKGMTAPGFLVDDVVDSGWTFTIVAALLRKAGSGPVFPLALAANR